MIKNLNRLIACRIRKRSLKLLNDFFFYLLNRNFLIVKFLRQEGLLLTYPSPNTMLINKTV
jgi:hypothetical protein